MRDRLTRKENRSIAKMLPFCILRVFMLLKPLKNRKAVSRRRLVASPIATAAASKRGRGREREGHARAPSLRVPSERACGTMDEARDATGGVVESPEQRARTTTAAKISLRLGRCDERRWGVPPSVRPSARVRSALQGPPTGRRAEGRVSIKLEMSYSLLFCSLESGTPLPKSSTRVTLIRSRSS